MPRPGVPGSRGPDGPPGPGPVNPVLGPPGRAPGPGAGRPDPGYGQGQGSQAPGQGAQGQGWAREQDHGPGHDHSPVSGAGGRGRGPASGGGPNSGGGHGGPPPGDGGHEHGPGDDGGHGHARGHGHSHSHGPAAPVSKHLRKVIAAVLIPFGAAVLVGLAVLWPGGTPGHERTGVGFDRQTQQATVTQVVEVSCSSVNASGGVPTGDTSTAEGSSAQQQADGTCKKATIRVDTGDDAGRTFTEIVQPDQSRQLSEGQEVVVAYEPSAPEDLQYSVADVNRRVPLALLAGIFAVAVVVVGRLRGVMALIALAVSFLVLNFFILPAILQGSNP
ncbi:YibE/F family protein, partial [Streptomyces prasinus]|uniref:YibE/F family protein n=1 Tax=Streptomyces prasinus TaxID=67345 RepID=UPI003D160219